jgi:hypothetical protein
MVIDQRNPGVKELVLDSIKWEIEVIWGKIGLGKQKSSSTNE